MLRHVQQCDSVEMQTLSEVIKPGEIIVIHMGFHGKSISSISPTFWERSKKSPHPVLKVGFDIGSFHL